MTTTTNPSNTRAMTALPLRAIRLSPDNPQPPASTAPGTWLFASTVLPNL